MSEGNYDEPALIAAMVREEAFAAQRVEMYGAEIGPGLAQRFMARAERQRRDELKVVRPMLAEAMLALRRSAGLPA